MCLISASAPFAEKVAWLIDHEYAAYTSEQDISKVMENLFFPENVNCINKLGKHKN